MGPVASASGLKRYACLMNMFVRLLYHIPSLKDEGLGTCGARCPCEWTQKLCLFDEYVCPPAYHIPSLKHEGLGTCGVRGPCE